MPDLNEIINSLDATQGQSVDRNVELRERLVDYDGYMHRTYGEQIVQYRQSGRLGRLLIASKYPEVADFLMYEDAQQSIVDARRSAPANEGNIVIG